MSLRDAGDAGPMCHAAAQKQERRCSTNGGSRGSEARAERSHKRCFGVRSAMVAGIVGLGLLMVPTRSLAFAENYRPFRFDLGGLYGYWHAASGNGGGLVLEPMFNLTDRLSIGLRQEMLFVRVHYQLSDAMGISQVFASWLQTSLMAKGEFYLVKGTIRPFVSFAGGVYANPDGSHQAGGAHFGVAPQLGIEAGVARLSILYEAVLGAHATITKTTNGEATQGPAVNYIAIELTFRIGGGARSTAFQ
jgi:hypothetical protein